MHLTKAGGGRRRRLAIRRARLPRPSHHHQHNVIIYGLLTPTYVLRTYLHHVEQHLHILTSSQLDYATQIQLKTRQEGCYDGILITLCVVKSALPGPPFILCVHFVKQEIASPLQSFWLLDFLAPSPAFIVTSDSTNNLASLASLLH